MATNVLQLLFKADTKEVKAAKQDLSELRGRVADLAKEVPGLGQVTGSLGNAFSGLRSAGGALAGGLVGVGIAAAGAAVALGGLGIAAAFSFGAQIDELSDMASKLGITTNEYLALSATLKDAGLSVNDLSGGLDRLSRSMSKSGDGAKGAGAAFKNLGIETKDANGNLRASTDVMDDLVKKYDEGNLTTREVADLQTVLGKNFRESIAAYKAAKEATEEYNDALGKGLGITKGAENAYNAFEKSLREGQKVALSMGSIFVELVIPAVTSLIQWFVKSYTEGGAVAKVFNVIANTTKILVDILSVLGQALGVVVDTLIVVGDVGQRVFKGLWQAITGDFKGAMGTLTGLFDGVLDRMKEIGGRALETVKNAAKVGVGIVQTLADPKDYRADAAARVRAENAPRTLGPVITPNVGGAGGQAASVKEQESAIQKLIESLQKQALATQNLSKEELVLKELQDKKYAGAKQSEKDQATAIARTIDEAQAKKMLGDYTRDLTKTTDNYVDGLMDEVRALNMNRRELVQLRVVKEIDRKTEEERQKLQEKGLLTVERENELLEENRRARLRVAAATQEAMDRDQDWLGNGVQNYLKSLGTMSEALTKFTESQLSAFGDGLVELFTGGEFSVRNFAATFVKSLAQMAVQMLIIKPILEWFKATMSSFGGGGWAGAIASLFSFHGNVFSKPHAGGGVLSGTTYGASNGTNWMGGEAGDEALVPLKRTSGGDLGVQMVGGKGGGTVISVNQQVTINGDVKDEETKNSFLREIAKQTKTIVKSTIADETRQGGMLSGARR